MESVISSGFENIRMSFNSFHEAISDLKVELNKEYNTTRSEETLTVQDDTRKTELIGKIQKIVWETLETIANGRAPFFRTSAHLPRSFDFENRLTENHEVEKKRIIRFENPRCRFIFTAILLLLCEVHKLFTTCQSCTRRELYYKNFHLFRSQLQVDRGMKEISFLLESPPWELKVLASSKGILFGPLTLKFKNGQLLDCRKRGVSGVSVPSNVMEVESISSSATWVLIVEKDTVFQALITTKSEGFLDSCIFITGKGFPDVSTRLMVCKFWELLRIPILALVDADPHGFEIMCVYRFGSLSMGSHSRRLACPAVRWLGVHPGDVRPLLLHFENLTPRDIHKIKFLLQRPHIMKNENFRNQLEILLKGNIKAEIEGVCNISPNYLTRVYLNNKIRCKDYF